MKTPCEGICDSLCLNGYCATCGLSIHAINHWAKLSNDVQQVEKQAAKSRMTHYTPKEIATFYQLSAS